MRLTEVGFVILLMIWLMVVLVDNYQYYYRDHFIEPAKITTGDVCNGGKCKEQFDKLLQENGFLKIKIIDQMNANKQIMVVAEKLKSAVDSCLDNLHHSCVIQVEPTRTPTPTPTNIP